MKKIIAFLLLAVAASAQNRNITINAPGQVTAGQSFTVPTSASTDATDGEQIGFYHAQYSTDGGANWTWFCSDVNVGGYAARNAYITAGGAGSTIIVRVKIAFRFGNAGDVDYAGNAIDWGGSWSAEASPPAQYAYISVVPPPNQPPTISWLINPSSAWVNQWFQIQARGNDADGNLSHVFVWREWVPHAFNTAYNGWQYDSDPNSTFGGVPGGVTFQASARDHADTYSSVIYHTVTINNRAPGPLAITVSGNTVQWNSTYGHYTAFIDNTITATSTLQDPDGNLANHTLRYQKVLGASPVDANWIIFGSITPSNGANSTKQAVLPTLPQHPAMTPGRWDFNSFGHDGYLSHPGDAKTLWLYGPNNGAQFISQTVPTTATTGDSFNVTIVMKNTGDKPWTTDSLPHRLGSQSPADNTRWGLNRVSLGATEIVNPGAQRTFTFAVTAPTAPGNHDFQWQMIEDGVQWFGDLTPKIVINVTDNDPPAAPTGLFASNKTATSLTLNWTASVENGVIALYEVYKDDVLYGTTSGATSLNITGLSNYTIYRFKVRARDGANLWSGFSAELKATLLPGVDTDGDGIPDDVETSVGLNPNNASDGAAGSLQGFTYDKINQLKRGPGAEYTKDAEGNIKNVNR